MTTDAVIKKATEYLGVPSVVGHEGFFMRYLGADFERLGYRADLQPGLLVIQGEDPLSAFVSAHVDRHGLISIGNGEYAYAAQYIKEIRYGQQNTSSQTELETISRRFEGERVVAYDPASGKMLGQGVITSCSACMANGDSVFNLHDMPPAPLDTPLAYARGALDQDGLYRGQLDNVISLAVLHRLCEEGFRGTLLLTAEEEIGKSWAHIAAWLERQDIKSRQLYIIDTSPYSISLPLDNGMVVLRNRDKSQTFNPALVDALKQRCADIGIPYHVKDEFLLAQGKQVRQLGSTELGKLIAETDGRWTGATIQIPTLMYHTSNETTSHACIKNYYELLRNVLIYDRIAL